MEPNEERQGNDKKAKRLAKMRERRRQRLLEETAEEREARLGKRREAWKKRLLKRKDRYDNERETWSKSDDILCLGKVSESNFYETSFIRIIKNLKPFVLF